MMNNDIHAFRREEMLKVHSDIKKLYGPEWKSKWISLFLLFIPQIYISLNIHKLSFRSSYEFWNILFRHGFAY